MRQRRWGAALVLGAAVLVGACSDGNGNGTAADADRRTAVEKDPVAATQAALPQVKQATIDLRFAANTGSVESPGKDVGFQLQGPFQLPTKDGDLPVTKLKNTQLLGDKEVSTTFTSTGSRAWIESDGKTVELKGSQLDSIRGTTKAGADLEALRLGSWFATREVTVEGDTTTVRGTLDAPVAVADVLALSGSFGSSSVKPFEAADADRLRALVRSSSVELVTSTRSAVLRRLHFQVRFAPEDRSKLAEVLPDLAGVGLTLDLRLADVGKPVKVTAPKGD